MKATVPSLYFAMALPCQCIVATFPCALAVSEVYFGGGLGGHKK